MDLLIDTERMSDATRPGQTYAPSRVGKVAVGTGEERLGKIGAFIYCRPTQRGGA
jgi:hypothetical protein